MVWLEQHISIEINLVDIIMLIVDAQWIVTRLLELNTPDKLSGVSV